MHLGNGTWITVDSCRDQRSKRHSLLEYFGQIGVDPAVAVLLVVGTHAHDDHIAGIADLYEQCSQATFVCSSAITSEEFLRAVKLDRSVAAGIRPSIREQYERIFLEARRRRHPGRKPLKRALENLSIWSRQPTSDLPLVDVRCISPSDEAVTRSLDDLAFSVARSVGDRKRFSNRDPNEFAVALWVQYGEHRVLLGADLPIGPAGCGWIGVLDNVPLDGRASVFKVPHHGSDTAHHDDVWQRLLEPDPVSLIAPFRGGRKSLPSAADAERISSLTSQAFITASPHSVARKPSVRQLGSVLHLPVWHLTFGILGGQLATSAYVGSLMLPIGQWRCLIRRDPWQPCTNRHHRDAARSAARTLSAAREIAPALKEYTTAHRPRSGRLRPVLDIDL